MALTKSDCSLLFFSKTLGVSFTESLMIGRLNLFASQQDIVDAIEKYKTNEKEIGDVIFADGYAEPLFKILGAEKIDSIDYSSYESATVIHDLNQPIPNELKKLYSAVIDGGTIEHVFNFPMAIKNCMEALKTGGHYIGISPANNHMGHGFYQFSPELYYRVFSEENGFKIKKMLVNTSLDDNAQWYEVADPKIVNSRVMLVNNLPLSLIIIAEKTADKNIFETTPQQVDYINTWNAHISIVENKMQENESRIKFLYRKIIPKRMKIIFRNVYNIFFVEKIKNEFIGEYNPDHFIKTEI